MSDIFELLGEDPEDEPFEERPVDTWVDFEDVPYDSANDEGSPT